MTPDDISGLTDSELIEAVATKVMGWEKRKSRDPRYPFHWGLPLADKDAWSYTAEDSWNPVSGSWDDTMEVVFKVDSYAFRIKKYPLSKRGRRAWTDSSRKLQWFIEFGGHAEGIHATDDNPQRAICLASLKAVSGV